MKKFNQMTEAQMCKTDGGLIPITVLLAATTSATAAFTAIQTIILKNK